MGASPPSHSAAGQRQEVLYNEVGSIYTTGWGKYNGSLHASFKNKPPRVSSQPRSLLHASVLHGSWFCSQDSLLLPTRPICLQCHGQPDLPLSLAVQMDTFQLHLPETALCSLAIPIPLFWRALTLTPIQHLGQKKTAWEKLITLPGPENRCRQQERGKPLAQAKISDSQQLCCNAFLSHTRLRSHPTLTDSLAAHAMQGCCWCTQGSTHPYSSCSHVPNTVPSAVLPQLVKVRVQQGTHLTATLVLEWEKKQSLDASLGTRPHQEKCQRLIYPGKNGKLGDASRYSQLIRLR